MSSPYRALFSVPGAKAFCVSGAIARLPISMMSLGIILALNHLYNDWTVAGVMSAVYILAVASVTPFYARLFDRFGQRRVGGVVLSVQVASMLLFACAVLWHVSIVVLFVLAIVMGLTQFSFGALVRTRWAYALPGPDHERQLNTAYALESAIDEVVFILGPILAAFLATSVHPVSQLFLPAIACGLGGAVFFSLKDTQPAVMQVVEVVPASRDDLDVRQAVDGVASLGVTGAHGVDSSDDDGVLSAHQLHVRAAKPRNVLWYRGVLPLMLVFIVFNMSFNAFDLSVTAMMKDIGMQRLLGVQLAMFAVGSCIGGLVFGARQLRGSNWRQMVEFLVLLTCGYVLIRVFMNNLVMLGLLSVLSGLCVSPVFATGNLIVKKSIPARQLTEGLSWLTTAGQVGGSLGSVLTGVVLDHADYHVGFLLPCITTACTLLLAIAGWWLVRRPQWREVVASHRMPRSRGVGRG